LYLAFFMARKSLKTVKTLIFNNRNAYYKKIGNIKRNVRIELGWGKVLFAQTYQNAESLVKDLLDEETGKRNLAFYVQKPQVALDLAQDKLFLSPSLAYRLMLTTYSQPNITLDPEIKVRLLTKKDIEGANLTYKESEALPIDFKNTVKNQRSKALTYFIAEKEGEILGIVIGIDHKELFNSPEEGASLWGLAVGRQARRTGIGNALVNYIASYYKTKGRNYLDLSVIYNNKRAITLYKKMGFKRLDRFCLKCRNEINEKLYFTN